MKEIMEERVIKETVYIAIDGIKFESKEDCQNYEKNYLDKNVALFDYYGDTLNFSSIDDLSDVYGIIFYKTDEEFVNNVLDYFEWFNIDTTIKGSEELYYKNKDNQIVFIFSETYDEWVNPYYRLTRYRKETSIIVKKEIKL